MNNIRESTMHAILPPATAVNVERMETNTITMYAHICSTHFIAGSDTVNCLRNIQKKNFTLIFNEHWRKF